MDTHNACRRKGLRQLQRQIAAQGAGDVEVRLLDRYRLLSRGELHPYDVRGLKMSRAVTNRVRLRLRQCDALVQVMHDHYAHLIYVKDDRNAQTLLPALARMMAEAGGAHAVLSHQIRCI
jgi:hypothetical protein